MEKGTNNPMAPCCGIAHGFIDCGEICSIIRVMQFLFKFVVQIPFKVLIYYTAFLFSDEFQKL